MIGYVLISYSVAAPGTCLNGMNVSFLFAGIFGSGGIRGCLIQQNFYIILCVCVLYTILYVYYNIDTIYINTKENYQLG